MSRQTLSALPIIALIACSSPADPPIPDAVFETGGEPAEVSITPVDAEYSYPYCAWGILASECAGCVKSCTEAGWYINDAGRPCQRGDAGEERCW